MWEKPQLCSKFDYNPTAPPIIKNPDFFLPSLTFELATSIVLHGVISTTRKVNWTMLII